MGVRRRLRSAVSGRFVKDGAPATTVRETVSDAPEVEAALRWRIGGLVAALMDAAASLDREGDAAAASRARAIAAQHIPEEKA
jgi:hypothetical protein